MKKYLLWILTVTFFIFNCSSRPGNKPFLQQTDIFISGTDGHHTYRIPSIIATKKGTVLAIREGRKGGQDDSGNIDLVMKRSGDGGKRWSHLMVVWNDSQYWLNVHLQENPLDLREIPDPIPDEGEILLKVTTCGVCHTELDEIPARYSRTVCVQRIHFRFSD